MIFVKEHSPGFIAVEFKPISENLKRMKQIPGAKFNGDKAWVLPLSMVHEFEKLFKGEYIWVTPRHKVMNEAPPPPPDIYNKIPKYDPNPLLKQGVKLYDYQQFGANFLAFVAYHTGHAFLTDKVGTGKTPQSIAAGKLLENQGLVGNTIVFCKASLKHQWLRDGIQKFTNDDGIVIDGTKVQRKKQYKEALDNQYKYVILNYELLLHDFDLIKEVVEKKDIHLAICDEAHKITNRLGKMNNALMKLVQPKKKPIYKGVKYVFFLTATPMSSKLEQLFGIFQLRRPDFFGKFTQFAKNHLKYSYNGRRQELVGYKNYDDIRNKTVNYMLRRTDNEIDMELPDIVEMNQWVQMTPLQRRLDAQAQDEQERIAEKIQGMYRQNAPKEQIEAVEGSLKAMMYVRKAIANHPQLLLKSNSEMIRDKFGATVASHKDGNKSPKLDELLELTEEMVIENQEKLIIFSEFETMVGILEKELTKKGYQVQTYTGMHNTKQKDAAIQEFKNNPDCNILIATNAAAEGLNLQFAKYLINYDLPWNPDILDQRNGRIRRGGSPHDSVKVVNLLGEDSIDKAIWAGLQSKLNLFNFMVENTEEQSEALKKVMYGE